MISPTQAKAHFVGFCRLIGIKRVSDETPNPTWSDFAKLNIKLNSGCCLAGR
jgi:hypothetical protein